MAQEEFHSPQASPGQSSCHLLCHLLSFFQMSRIDMRRLKTFAIISPLLYMSDRRAKQRRTVFLGDSKQGYFAIELDELFNNKFTDITTTTAATILPCMFQFVGTLHQRLAFAGGRHQRFNHARKTDLIGSFFQFVQRSGIKIFGGFQSQFLSSKVAYGFTVHGKVHRTGTGHYLNAFFLEVIQTFGTDSFDLRHDNVRLMFSDRTLQCLTIEHIKYFTFIGHLHSRSPGIRIAGNDILSFTLSGNNKLFS